MRLSITPRIQNTHWTLFYLLGLSGCVSTIFFHLSRLVTWAFVVEWLGVAGVMIMGLVKEPERETQE